MYWKFTYNKKGKKRGFFLLPNIRITAKGRGESSYTRYMRKYVLGICNKNGEEGPQQKE